MMHQNLNALSHKDKNNHKEGRKEGRNEWNMISIAC